MILPAVLFGCAVLAALVLAAFGYSATRITRAPDSTTPLTDDALETHTEDAR